MNRDITKEIYHLLGDSEINAPPFDFLQMRLIFIAVEDFTDLKPQIYCQISKFPNFVLNINVSYGMTKVPAE